MQGHLTVQCFNSLGPETCKPLPTSYFILGLGNPFTPTGVEPAAFAVPKSNQGDLGDS